MKKNGRNVYRVPIANETHVADGNLKEWPAAWAEDGSPLPANGQPGGWVQIGELPYRFKFRPILGAVRVADDKLHVALFLEEGTVFHIGVAPRRIDIITAASGLQFEEAFTHAIAVEIEGIKVHIPSVADLIRNKRASGRTKDLADAETLEDLDS